MVPPDDDNPLRDQFDDYCDDLDKDVCKAHKCELPRRESSTRFCFVPGKTPGHRLPTPVEDSISGCDWNSGTCDAQRDLGDCDSGDLTPPEPDVGSVHLLRDCG